MGLEALELSQEVETTINDCRYPTSLRFSQMSARATSVECKVGRRNVLKRGQFGQPIELELDGDDVVHIGECPNGACNYHCSGKSGRGFVEVIPTSY